MNKNGIIMMSIIDKIITVIIIVLNIINNNVIDVTYSSSAFVSLLLFTQFAGTESICTVDQYCSTLMFNQQYSSLIKKFSITFHYRKLFANFICQRLRILNSMTLVNFFHFTLHQQHGVQTLS